MIIKFFKNFDPWILFCLLAISGFSLTILWSIRPDLFDQQLIFLLLGLFAFFVFSSVDSRFYVHLKWPIYIFSCFLLLLTFVFSEPTRGSIRWLEIGELRIQPSEILKPFLILSLASFVNSLSSRGIKKIILALSFIALPAFLIFKQPDLGNTIIFLLIFTAILFLGGIQLKFFLSAIFLGIISVPFLWRFLQDYQKERIFSFLNPQVDPLGTGYHTLQSVVAVGSGQIFGRGLGRGTQSHLRFLPEQHTDFIFASLAEELGFLGCTLLIILYVFLLFRILKITQRAEDMFSVLTLIGIFTMILAQIIINVGMNIGLLPITGITLPLISYGGSSIISIMISLGIVESISRQKRQAKTLEIK